MQTCLTPTMEKTTAYIILIVLYFTGLCSTLRVTPASVSADPNERVIFICKEDDGTYPPSVKWRLPDGTELGPEATSTSTRIWATNYFLNIENTVATDTGAYTCIDTSDNSDTAVAQLEVTVPPHIINPMPIQEIHLGQTVLIMCAISPGYPEPTVIWYKENHHIDGEDMRITVKDNGLEIQNVQQSDEGMYECYVHNEVGYDSLDIHVAFRAPPLFLHNQNTTVILKKGESIDLDCSAAGAPMPSYSWVAPPTSSIAQSPPNLGPILEITSSDTNDGGNYTCTADNGVGEINKTFVVSIVVPPSPLLASYNRTIVPGHPVTLPCPVQAQPSPKYTWFHYNRNNPSFPQSPIIDFNKFTVQQDGSLHVSNFEMTDFNLECYIELLCFASNHHGHSSQYHTIFLDKESCQSTAQPLPLPTDETTTPTTTEIPTTTDEGTDATEVEDDQSSLEEESKDNNEQTILAGVFSFVILCLFIAVVVVTIYVIRIYCCRKSKTKKMYTISDIEQGRPPLPPRPPLPVGTAHHVRTAIQLSQPRPLDDGTYSRLNHQPRNSSTSSAGSGAPLLQSLSSVEEDEGSVFAPDDPTLRSPHFVIVRAGSGKSIQGFNSAASLPASVLIRSSPGSVRSHATVPEIIPEYLQLMDSTRNPPTHYEVIPQ